MGASEAAGLMAAHLRAIHQATCGRCDRRATVTLHNTHNEAIADYCTSHGNEALRDLLKWYPQEGD